MTRGALKKYRGLIALAAIALVCVVAYLLVAASNDPGVTGRLYPVRGGDAISSIDIVNEYGEFHFEPDGEGEWTVTSGGNTYRAHDEKMQLMLAALGDFTISRTLDGTGPAYGLDDPAASVTVVTGGGAEYSFDVGSETVSRADNYVKSGDTVAVTSSSNVAQLTGSLLAYRDKEVFTVDPTSLVQIGYYNGGELVMSLGRVDGGWVLEYPFEAPARNIEMEDFLTMLNGLTVAGYPDMKEYSAAGLGLNDAGEALMLVDMDGNTQVMEFGGVSGTGRFVRTGGEDDVAVLYNADIDLSYMDPYRMMLIAPLRTTMDAVKSITVEADGETYAFDANDEAQTASLNGRLIDYNGFIRVFYRYITLVARGRDESGPQSAEPVMTLKTVSNDGNEVILKLLPRDDGTYYMDMGGDVVYYMDKSQADDLMDRITGIEFGESQ